MSSKTFTVFTGEDGVDIAKDSTLSSLVSVMTSSMGTIGTGSVSSGSLTTLANIQDSNNTNLSTLASGATWTGTWTDTTGYSQIVTNFRSDQSGSFYMYFSSDGNTSDRTIGPYSLSANTDSPQPLAPIRKYYRFSFSNASSASANLRIETRLSSVPGVFQTRLQDSVTNLNTSTLQRSVLFGRDSNGTTFRNVNVGNNNSLKVHLEDPLGAFGELLVAELEPRIQIDATYGILSTDHEALSDSSPGTGTTTASGSLFVCQTGTGVGGYGVIRSRRIIRYRPGEGIRLRYTSMFTTGVANSLQLAGGFTATEALCFGYSGTSFGILRRIAGALQIARLTINTGSSGAETLTVKLNDTNFSLSVVSGSSSSLAEQIAEYQVSGSSIFSGWSSTVSPQNNSNTVTFIQSTPAAITGSFTFSSSGTAAGTFSIIQSGSANDDTTGFIPQTQWNIDRMDGSNGEYNPSGITLDPTKLNIYEIIYPFLGAGAITFLIKLPGGSHQEVHRIEYPNNNTIPNMKNPTLRLGWIAASLGSTTNLTVKGASAAGFVEGKVVSMRDPFGTAVNNFTAGNTEYVALAIRVGSVFNNMINQREVWPGAIVVGTETANRVIRVRLLLNPVLSGTTNWTSIDSARSSVEYCTPATLQPSGGLDVGHLICASGSPTLLNLRDTTLRLEAGDVLALCVQTASSTAVISAAINGLEN